MGVKSAGSKDESSLGINEMETSWDWNGSLKRDIPAPGLQKGGLAPRSHQWLTFINESGDTIV